MKFRCLAPSPVPIPPPATRLQALFVRNAPIGFHHSIPPLIPLSHHSHFPIPRFSPHSDYNSIINIVTAIRLKASFNGRDFRARSSSPDSPPPPPSPSSISQQVIVSSAFTIAFAVANRVLYKLALVPMKEYPFFLAQLTTFGYVIVYFVILYMRYNGGVVTDEMMAQPKSLYVAIGVLEALGVALGMVAAAMLPGPAIPILSQTFFVWQLILSVFILGRTYTISQIAGCLLVAIGVAVAVTSGSNANQLLYGVELVWPVLMIASSAFQAGASIIKEFVFIDAASRLKGKTLDIFVVNSFGSGFQDLSSGRMIGNADFRVGLYVLNVNHPSKQNVSYQSNHSLMSTSQFNKESEIMMLHFLLGRPNFLYLKRFVTPWIAKTVTPCIYKGERLANQVI
ncbi:protein CLT2, chloroplastic isoform X2 [Humulus lupulus]|uniref:protein CLT2, chloroplastic isoform X2 n=1 Tax=Humulus lupulus TaxID=3486 RepID=UPI002B417F46|nr:protein CLT2, chloroplastic isoform X2 [Humulus lupulus]